MEMPGHDLIVSFTEKELCQTRWPQMIRATLLCWITFEEPTPLQSSFERVMAETDTALVIDIIVYC